MFKRPENLYTYLFTALLVLLAALLIYWGLSIPAVGYEAHFYEAASLFLQEGNIFLPRLSNGELLYHTPLFPYWLSSLGHWLLPNTPLGFRLMHILFALLAFWGFFTTAREYLDARAAFYSCCVLLSSLPFCWQLILATPDSLLAISICMVLFSFYRFLKTRKKSYLGWLYGALTAGILFKGLAGLFLPVLMMMVYLMFKIKMDGRTLERLQAGKGFLLVLLLTTPWFVYIGIQTGGTWLQEFFLGYHIERFFGKSDEAEAAFYLPFLYSILLLLPFGVFLPASFSYAWKLKVKKDLLMLACLSLLLALLFFAISDTFYPHYLLPALPFAALLIGFRFSSMAGRPLLKMKSSVGLALLVLLSFGLPVFLYLTIGGSLTAEGDFPLLQYYALLGILPVGTLVSLFLWHRKKTDAGFCLLSFAFLLFNVLLVQLAGREEILWNELSILLQ